MRQCGKSETPRWLHSNSRIRDCFEFRISNFGFTLVELLVVIAIIGLLAAMLLPALKTARDKAKAAQCLSNQRQVTAAIVSWGTDHNDHAPWSSWTWSGLPEVGQLVLSQSGATLPRDSILVTRKYLTRDTMKCPAPSMAEMDALHGGIGYGYSYGYNFQFVGYTDAPGQCGVPGGIDDLPYMNAIGCQPCGRTSRLGDAKNPSATVLMTELIGNFYCFTSGMCLGYTSVTNTVAATVPHLKRTISVAGYADGHGELVKAVLINPSNWSGYIPSNDF